MHCHVLTFWRRMISQVVSVFLLSSTCLALQAPSIVEYIQQVSLIVDIGDKVELPCRSTGQPSPKVSWFKDTSREVSADLILASGSLVIDSFREEDEGLYHCTVTNEVGSMRSPEVAVLRSWYKTTLPDIVGAGEILAVSQKADIDVSNLAATWTIRPVNGQETKKSCPSADCPAWVQVTRVDQFATVNSVIRLDYSQITQAFPGHKEFEVNSSLGNLAMRSFTVQFNGAGQRRLDIDVLPEDMYVENGKDAVLFCISNAENSTYTWMKNDKFLDVEGSDRLSILMDGTLRIERVTAEENALYTCSVTGPSYRPGTKSANALLSVYNRPQVSLKKTANSEGSGFLLSCHANGSAPMDVDLLCNGEVRQTGEAGDELMAEINTEPVLVTKNAVCQCFVSGEFGSVQDDVFVNISELTNSSLPHPTLEEDTDTPSVRPDTASNLARDSNDDNLSGGEMAGLIIAVVLIVLIVTVVVIVALLHRRKPQQRRESRRELRTSDIGEPVPAASIIKSMEAGSSKGHIHSEPAAQPDSEQRLKPKTEVGDSKRNSRNDFAGTTSGNGLLEYQSLAGSQDNLKVSASRQKKGDPSFDIDTSLGYDNPNTVQKGKDKQTRTSVVALRKDGYVVVEEDMRTQQNVIVELHRGSRRDDHTPKISSKPVPVGSGEYARLDPEPHPKHPPPVPPKSATPSSSVPYGMEDDWHFKLNGDEYAIAEAGAKRRSTPSDEGIRDLAYAFSGLPQEEKGEVSDSSLMKQTGSRFQPARADSKDNVRYATLMPET